MSPGCLTDRKHPTHCSQPFCHCKPGLETPRYLLPVSIGSPCMLGFLQFIIVRLVPSNQCCFLLGRRKIIPFCWESLWQPPKSVIQSPNKEGRDIRSWTHHIVFEKQVIHKIHLEPLMLSSEPLKMKSVKKCFMSYLILKTTSVDYHDGVNFDAMCKFWNIANKNFLDFYAA